MLRWSYAILSHPYRLDVVRDVWSRIDLLPEVPSNWALFSQYVNRCDGRLALPSTAVIYLWPRLGLHWLGQSSGIALIGAYLLTIGVGAVIGVVAGFLLTRKVLAR
jgi:hypothetical protein